MVVLILTFELDLKKHFLDVRHDTYVMTSEPDKNISEIWLKFWTFKETGVAVSYTHLTLPTKLEV